MKKGHTHGGLLRRQHFSPLAAAIAQHPPPAFRAHPLAEPVHFFPFAVVRLERALHPLPPPSPGCKRARPTVSFIVLKRLVHCQGSRANTGCGSLIHKSQRISTAFRTDLHRLYTTSRAVDNLPPQGVEVVEKSEKPLSNASSPCYDGCVFPSG